MIRSATLPSLIKGIHFDPFFFNDVKPREEHDLRSTLGEQGGHPYVNRRPTSGVPPTPGSCY